jgi:DnaJ-class molecular chaperone
MVKVTIIEKYDSYTILECARCGGSGSIITGFSVLRGSNKYGTCPTCDGNGKVKIESSPPFTNCGKCNGDGKNNGTCTACNGTGILVDDELSSY